MAGGTRRDVLEGHGCGERLPGAQPSSCSFHHAPAKSAKNFSASAAYASTHDAGRGPRRARVRDQSEVGQAVLEHVGALGACAAVGGAAPTCARAGRQSKRHRTRAACRSSAPRTRRRRACGTRRTAGSRPPCSAGERDDLAVVEALRVPQLAQLPAPSSAPCSRPACASTPPAAELASTRPKRVAIAGRPSPRSRRRGTTGPRGRPAGTWPSAAQRRSRRRGRRSPRRRPRRRSRRRNASPRSARRRSAVEKVAASLSASRTSSGPHFFVRTSSRMSAQSAW